MNRIIKKLSATIFIVTLFLLSPSAAHALSLTVHVPEKYTNVSAGERLYFELDVKYPENPTRKDLRLTYQILEGESVLAESKVLKAVEAQASFIDFVVIPENAKGGIHTIKVTVGDYDKLSEEVSATFHVVGKQSDQIKLYLLLILGAIGVVGILVIVNIFLTRKK